MLRAAAALSAVVCLLCPAAASAAAPDRVVVGFTPGADAQERRDARAAVDGEIRSTLVPRVQVLEVEDGTAHEAAATLERDRDVAWAEVDRLQRAAWTPDDPLFHRQWALDNAGIWGGTPGVDVDAPQAWDVTRGDGVLVGVVDSGVHAGHTDAGALHVNPGEIAGNGADDDGNGRVDDVRGWDFVNGDADPADDNNHGTAVGSVINAPADNAVAMAGIAPGATTVHAKVLGPDGRGWATDIADGMDYVADLGAKIVNVSIGGGKSNAEAAVIAAHPGTLFVISAGNDSKDNDDPAAASYPCAEPAPNVLCVGASTNTDAAASFTNVGRTTVDLMAPGQWITGAQWSTGAFTEWSGTSFSSPLTAGAAALLKARRPTATVAQIKSALMSSADPVAAFAPLTVTGGRLDARAALLAIDGAAPAPPAPAVVTPPEVSGSAAAGQTLTSTTGTWSGSPTQYAREWRSCDAAGANCTTLAGQTGATLLLTEAHVGRRIVVRVTATNDGGPGTPSSSSATARVAGVSPSFAVAPSVAGSPQAGRQLTASAGALGGVPAPTAAIQWQRCDAAGGACADIAGATTAAIVLGDGAVGARLRVRVTATNSEGTQTATSPTTAVVAAATTTAVPFVPPVLGLPAPPVTDGADEGPATPQPVVAAPARAVRLGSVLRLDGRGRATLSVGCTTAAPCTVRLRLLTAAKPRALLGRLTLRLRGGRTATARVPLTQRARRLARRRPVRVLAEARAAGGTTTARLSLSRLSLRRR